MYYIYIYIYIYIYEKIFKEYFSYESPSFLVKDLYENNQRKNDMTVKYLNV